MEGLIEEGNEMMKEKAEPMVSDAGLITSAQRVEHYEIAAYGGARTFAQMLGMNDVAQMLQQTLDEEKRTDEKLTAIAEGWINQSAMQMSDGTEYNERNGGSMGGSQVAKG
jgi:ferritin-like metal-binding protein YciE